MKVKNKSTTKSYCFALALLLVVFSSSPPSLLLVPPTAPTAPWWSLSFFYLGGQRGRGGLGLGVNALSFNRMVVNLRRQHHSSSTTTTSKSSCGSTGDDSPSSVSSRMRSMFTGDNNNKRIKFKSFSSISSSSDISDSKPKSRRRGIPGFGRLGRRLRRNNRKQRLLPPSSTSTSTFSGSLRNKLAGHVTVRTVQKKKFHCLPDEATFSHLRCFFLDHLLACVCGMQDIVVRRSKTGKHHIWNKKRSPSLIVVSDEMIKGAAITGAVVGMMVTKAVLVSSATSIGAAYIAVTNPGPIGDVLRKMGSAAWNTTQSVMNMVYPQDTKETIDVDVDVDLEAARAKFSKTTIQETVASNPSLSESERLLHEAEIAINIANQTIYEMSNEINSIIMDDDTDERSTTKLDEVVSSPTTSVTTTMAVSSSSASSSSSSSSIPSASSSESATAITNELMLAAELEEENRLAREATKAVDDMISSFPFFADEVINHQKHSKSSSTLSTGDDIETKQFDIISETDSEEEEGNMQPIPSTASDTVTSTASTNPILSSLIENENLMIGSANVVVNSSKPPPRKEQTLYEAAARSGTTDWSKLTVVLLKEELRSRDLRVSGNKAELVARLQEYENEHAKTDDAESLLENEGISIQSSIDLDISDEMKALEQHQEQLDTVMRNEGYDEIDHYKADYGEMTVMQLKDELRKLGLRVSGRKAELITRLESYC